MIRNNKFTAVALSWEIASTTLSDLCVCFGTLISVHRLNNVFKKNVCNVLYSELVNLLTNKEQKQSLAGSLSHIFPDLHPLPIFPPMTRLLTFRTWQRF